MTTMRVYDPAMCCSTGVCGTSVDPQLPRFAADLEWLAAQGVAVERFNLAQQPGAFAADPDVREALTAGGEASLPLVQVDGAIKSTGVYPSREELAAWAGVEPPVPGTQPVEPHAATVSCCNPAEPAPLTFITRGPSRGARS